MEHNTAAIQVLGSGCPTCEKLYDMAQQAVDELGLGMTVEYITDVQKIVDMGLMQSPVLAVNGKPALAGFVPDMERIKKAILDNL